MIKAKPTLDDVLAFVRSCTPEERKRVAEVVYTHRCGDVQDAKSELKRDDLVFFHPRRRGHPFKIEGKIVAVNRTTVTVQPNHGGRQWRVQADLVKKVPTAAG